MIERGHVCVVVGLKLIAEIVDRLMSGVLFNLDCFVVVELAQNEIAEQNKEDYIEGRIVDEVHPRRVNEMFVASPVGGPFTLAPFFAHLMRYGRVFGELFDCRPRHIVAIQTRDHVCNAVFVQLVVSRAVQATVGRTRV